ncbi:hypothetical protein ABIA95_003079 [Bradyrhizobium sp. LA8.1]|uniref:hypothetical protein n=1 Tax=unclassified Bradyrhizobium TaxID=2631580 RepID=UPI00339A4096
MSTLSAARQFEFDFRSDNSDVAQQSISSGAAPRTRAGGADIFDMPRFPTFSYPTSVGAAASRNAARLNAASIDPVEHKGLLEERQMLLDKELAETLSHEEANRLAYVRWSLDRVDDAKYGLGLERLESMVSDLERFHTDVRQFHSELDRLKKSGGRRDRYRN